MKLLKKVLGITVVLIVVGVPVLALANTQSIQDWAKLRGYNPPADIANLATEDTMTDKARHLFYINHPQLIADKTTFRQNCTVAEQTIVLGCYHSTEAGIAIYDVTDARLNGVKEVTAAHEMLHGAYDRLSQKDKNYVDGLLQSYYATGLTDQRIKDTIAAYQKSEPNELVDEMHSVFGTEVANLPAPLEDYYKQYFSNRQAVTDFSAQYESIFAQNQQQLQSLKSQIDQLKTQLNSDQQTIQNDETALSSQNQQMQNLLNGGQTGAYNAQVDSYNSQVSSLKALIASYNSRVNEVNDLVEQYNNVAYTQEGLYSSLDTRLQTQTTQ